MESHDAAFLRHHRSFLVKTENFGEKTKKGAENV